MKRFVLMMSLSACAAHAPPPAYPVTPSPEPQPVVVFESPPRMAAPEQIASTRGPEAITVDRAPPPAHSEFRPPIPFHGALWIAGHWHWNNGQWEWVAGRWVGLPRRNAVWATPTYLSRDGRVQYVPGHWRYGEEFEVPTNTDPIPDTPSSSISTPPIAGGLAPGQKNPRPILSPIKALPTHGTFAAPPPKIQTKQTQPVKIFPPVAPAPHRSPPPLHPDSQHP